jgi:hypothetical protein
VSWVPQKELTSITGPLSNAHALATAGAGHCTPRSSGPPYQSANASNGIRTGLVSLRRPVAGQGTQRQAKEQSADRREDT